eukprot:2118503-Pyramimonas_sp.AAC.1
MMIMYIVSAHDHIPGLLAAATGFKQKGVDVNPHAIMFAQAVEKDAIAREMLSGSPHGATVMFGDYNELITEVTRLKLDQVEYKMEAERKMRGKGSKTSQPNPCADETVQMPGPASDADADIHHVTHILGWRYFAEMMDILADPAAWNT